MAVFPFREALKRSCSALGSAFLVTLLIFALVPLMIADSTGKTGSAAPVSVQIRTLRLPDPVQATSSSEPVREPPQEPEMQMQNPVSSVIPRPERDLPVFSPDIRLSAVRGPTLAMPKADAGLQGFELGEVDQAPRTLVRIPPVYPFRARNMGIEGAVRVRFLVGIDGKAGQITILEADPPGIFEDAVIQAVKSWRFEATVRDGRKVSAWIVAPLRFQLGNDG